MPKERGARRAKDSTHSTQAVLGPLGRVKVTSQFRNPDVDLLPAGPPPRRYGRNQFVPEGLVLALLESVDQRVEQLRHHRPSTAQPHTRRARPSTRGRTKGPASRVSTAR